MVVKPGEKQSIELTETDRKHLAYLESMVDEGLRDSNYTFAAHLFIGTCGERREVFERYREAGWKVERVAGDVPQDPSAGAYYSFSYSNRGKRRRVLP